MSYTRRVHIEHPVYSTLTLCGQPRDKARCGEPRSDTHPPAVFNPETEAGVAESLIS